MKNPVAEAMRTNATAWAWEWALNRTATAPIMVLLTAIAIAMAANLEESCVFMTISLFTRVAIEVFR